MAQKLANDCLPELHRKLKLYLPDSLKVYGLLHSTISGLWEGFDFWVDKWPDFTAVICCPDPVKRENTYDNNIYSIFATDQTGITNLLHHPDVVDWKRNIIFGGVSKQWWDFIRKAASDINGHVEEPLDEVLTYVIEDGNDLPQVSLPTDVFTGKVSEDMTDIVMTNWEHSRGDCREYIRQIILRYPSMCLRTSEGNLIGYALVYPFWSVGFLFVLPEFRGQGYGSTIKNLLARKLINDNKTPWANIDVRNSVAQHVASKAGLKQVPDGIVSWIQYKVGLKENCSCFKEKKQTKSCCGQNKMCI